MKNSPQERLRDVKGLVKQINFMVAFLQAEENETYFPKVFFNEQI